MKRLSQQETKSKRPNKHSHQSSPREQCQLIIIFLYLAQTLSSLRESTPPYRESKCRGCLSRRQTLNAPIKTLLSVISSRVVTINYYFFVKDHSNNSNWIFIFIFLKLLSSHVLLEKQVLLRKFFNPSHQYITYYLSFFFYYLFKYNILSIKVRTNYIRHCLK